MTRHELRERIFKTIFQIPFYEEKVPELVSDDEDLPELEEEDAQYVSSKVALIQDKLESIDKVISEHSKNWNMSRIGKVELAILRLAIYEIEHDADIPDKVAVNEAIELAKKYSDDKSAGFINGVLSGLIE